MPDCSSLTCLNGGSCADTTGLARCACDAGFTGSTCASCAQGFQDHDGDGLCRPGCPRSGLTCLNGGYCTEATGTASCSCTAAYQGQICTDCAGGHQDEDGNGRCGPVCSTRGFVEDAGTTRLMVRIATSGREAYPPGTVVSVPVAPNSVLDQWLTPDAGDAGPTLYVHRADGGSAQVARFISSRDGGTGVLRFRTVDFIDAGAESTDYGLYRAPSAILPFVGGGADGIAVRVDRPASTLLCDVVRQNFFFTIQLRQIGTERYEINVGDGTADAQAYARITVTDVGTGATILDRNYTNGAGSCCTAPSLIAQEQVTISSRLFRVRMESREFTRSHRYFGCEDFATGNPPTSQIGSTELVYEVVGSTLAGAFCGE